MSTYQKIPRIIWLLWFQGFDSAPDTVRLSLESWRKKNPKWEVRALDRKSLGKYLDPIREFGPGFENFWPQMQADLVRINLLSRYGGVWADATCFCCRPLDEWLDEHMDEGLFMFSDPFPRVRTANYFIASSYDSRMTNLLCSEANRYAKGRYLRKFEVGDSRWRSFVNHVLWRFPFLYFTPLVRDIFKVSSHFWFFLLFDQVYCKNKWFQESWHAVPKRPASEPEYLQREVWLLDPLSYKAKQVIDDVIHPVYKLWKFKTKDIPTGSNLAYLFRRHSESYTKTHQ